ncbi:FRE8 [[Candida] subhashii]|uniref:FRE8 n=1 Tax=[Candida] subhashii TaxID=561895 RepID=A0A8J5QKC6_9ASCO|nr:FRE8 [[Candida] subhashii]KAG7663579.1 FRE8 [[Candida] subhashii]
MNITSLFDYFHYPISKTKPYTQYRKYVTCKYSIIFNIILILYLIAIAIYKLLIRRGYNLTVPISITTTTRIIIFWSILLSFFSLVEINHGDLIFLAKRLGRLSANCLSFTLFLTLRPSLLPNTLYLTLLPLHKWVSRLIIVQAVIHTIIYCRYYQFKHSLHKIFSVANLYGWVALMGFIIIIITSISKFRNKWFKVFYFNHYICSWIIVLSLQFHVRPLKFTPFTIINITILVYQIIYRLLITKTSEIGDFKVIDVSPNLSLIEFPNNLISKKANKPGAHIRLTNYHPNWLIRIYKQYLIPNYHPYTLVSLPQDNYQRLIIRKSKFIFDNSRKYSLTASFDPFLLFITNSNKNFTISKLSINTKRILIVIGGSAISFALPLLRVMNYHGIPVKIIWVIKDYRDLIILKYFDGFIHGQDFEIFITGDKEIQRRQSYASFFRPNNHNDLEFGNEDENTPLIDQWWEEINEVPGSLHKENQLETVEINIDEYEEEEEDDACTRDFQFSNSNETDEDEDDYYHHGGRSQEFEVAFDSPSPDMIPSSSSVSPLQKDSLIPIGIHSHQSSTSHNNHSDALSRKSSVNEPFQLPTSTTVFSNWHLQFKQTVKLLKLQNKIYKGRPKLGHRYYNWCINGEGFTQCLGPILDANNNFVCCKDVLGANKKTELPKGNTEDVWVISAGPRGLVDNVKVWASENGLKFHEEAFYS